MRTTMAQQQERDVCDKAFSMCIDICQTSLNLLKERLLNIRKFLDKCKSLHPQVGKQIYDQIVKIFSKMVKIQIECRKVLQEYLSDRSRLTW